MMEAKKLNHNEQNESVRPFHLSSITGYGDMYQESITPMASIVDNSPEQRKWADSQFGILKKRIEEFEHSLDEEHEVGVMLASFGQPVMMNVVQIEYENPVLFVFKGYVGENEATLIQHINQLNFILTAVKKEEDRPKRKIGFVVQTDDD